MCGKSDRVFIIKLLLATAVLTANGAGFTNGSLPEITGLTPPPELNTNPGPEYGPRFRVWQGIPSIECSPGGRLWATWYAGPIMEGGKVPQTYNYCPLVTSDDDGKTWSSPVAVYDASTLAAGSTGDPNLQIDPDGHLWWMFCSKRENKEPPITQWAIRAENAEDPHPVWSRAVYIAKGVSLNKPTVLSNGDWIQPVDAWGGAVRTQFYVSKDKGQTWSFLSDIDVKDVTFSEHMVVERSDGSLWMMARTTYGISQAESFDKGKTWVNERPFTKTFSVNQRFFLRRLKSGRMLLVVNDVPAGRRNLTAMLSEDDGKTWPHKLLLDERNVSYPDGAESANGSLYIIYDLGRYTLDEQAFYFAKITEQDIIAGKLVNPQSRLKQLINRLADYKGGVHVSGEHRDITAEYNRKTSVVVPVSGSVIYREIFPNASAANRPLADAGWQAHTGPSALPDSQVVMSGSSGSPSNLEAVNSAPAGNEQARGFLFDNATARSPHLLWTKEIDVRLKGNTTQISWRQSGDASVSVHVAILVNGTWYVSMKAFVPPATSWGVQTLSLADSEWFALDFTPGERLELGATALLTGDQLQGIGFFIPALTGKIRLDAVEIRQ